ncbi:MAG: hypothetical protein IK073_02210 [Paludibacteraceae bacterium]|nr:hypothetical protein [Paludibacteraceae bacterium]
MDIEKEKCCKCGKWFRVIEITTLFGGNKMREEITCPYCKAENGAIMTNGKVTTEAIEPQQNI